MSDLPVWARHEAFPPAPDGWGWVGFNHKRHSCESLAALVAAIRDDRDARMSLVWLHGHSHMMLPEEVDEAAEAVLAARQRRAADDLLDAIGRLRRFAALLAGLVLYLAYQGWTLAPPASGPMQRLESALRAVLNSHTMGIALLVVLIFAFIPWYQARKRFGQFRRWSLGDLAQLVPPLRFETWLQLQKAPFTRLLLVLIAMVGLAQLTRSMQSGGAGLFMSLFEIWGGIAEAGLVKDRYLGGEWWRLLTAPFLHGNVVHFLFNALALLYLGKRLEVFARWPHLPLVFLCAMCVGGEASARFLQAPSVGASGGLMGWLGFLLVFESLHVRLVPKNARRRLLAGVLLTALIGAIGYRFIDNAAHLGGMFAGMLYAWVVFPKSSSPGRPHTLLADRIAGSLALGVLMVAALIAAWQTLGLAGG